MAGDTETGVCIMQMEAGLDTGPVLLRQAVPIASYETTGTLHDQLSELGASMIVYALRQFQELAADPQPEDGVTYAAKIDKSEARIDWSKPAIEVDRLIRGLSPFPGAWTEMSGERVKLRLSRLVDKDGPAGQVLDDTLTIACGDGAIRPLRLQRAGKAAQDVDEFQRGWPVAVGTRL
jgi:methionyl-tRNA formyltransferase